MLHAQASAVREAMIVQEESRVRPAGPLLAVAPDDTAESQCATRPRIKSVLHTTQTDLSRNATTTSTPYTKQAPRYAWQPRAAPWMREPDATQPFLPVAFHIGNEQEQRASAHNLCPCTPNALPALRIVPPAVHAPTTPAGLRPMLCWRHAPCCSTPCCPEAGEFFPRTWRPAATPAPAPNQQKAYYLACTSRAHRGSH